MVVIRNTNEIISSLIDYIKLVQPDADTKVGSMIRDLLIEPPATQISLLYDELSSVSSNNSFRLVVGSDLDNLSKNFGMTRKLPTAATGVAILTFKDINAPLQLSQNDLVIANNGFSFQLNASSTISSNSANYYRSIANKYKNDLDLLGITDEYAVEVTVIATSTGLAGNIGKYSLNRTTITGISNVFNPLQFSGGTDQETDAAYRNRVLSVFTGSSIGTALGYLNTALATTGVIDAQVIQPSDPLMTRDGTQTTTDASGNITIISEGTGGKVDVIVLGNNLVENTDSYIYQDKSNIDDPTNSKNDIILGQIAADANKTINRKRVDDIKNGILPEQPVSDILEVTGSSSGSNFIEKSVDQYGRITGNYQLKKDTGVYAGSPWGFDKFTWISDRISDFPEDRLKGQLNGQDTLTFTDVTEISKIQQNVQILNENSTVNNSDRSILQLLHYPAAAVTRVFNVTTGERYIVKNQNLDSLTNTNLSGRIQISGNTLPTPSDILQVDYNWIIEYDQYADYDGLKNTTNLRDVTDSVDWGYSNQITNEKITFTLDGSNTFYLGTASHPISSVISANLFKSYTGQAILQTTGLYSNRYIVNINNLKTTPESLDFVKLKNANTELYNTSDANGLYIVTPVVVGLEIYYNLMIILPTDTLATDNCWVEVIIDSTDIYNVSSNIGTVSGNDITIPSDNVESLDSTLYVLVNYIANVQETLSSSTPILPFSRSGNGFVNNSNGFTNNSIINLFKKEHQIVQKNGSNEYYIELSILNTDYSFVENNIVNISRLSDGKLLWNSDNIGSITFNPTTFAYQVILNGFNSPAIGDRVFIVYQASDIRRFQPFSYSNTVIDSNIQTLNYDSIDDNFFIDLGKFVDETGLTFDIIDGYSDNIYLSLTDGYIVENGLNAIFSSSSYNFQLIPDLLNLKVKITDPTNVYNSGTFDITSYNSTDNTLVIQHIYNNIDLNQISIYQLSDGVDYWNTSCTLDLDQNKLIIPFNSSLVEDGYVNLVTFNYAPLREAFTKLIVTTSDQVVNPGTISILGTTVEKATDIIFTATYNGLKQNVSEALRKVLNLTSAQALPKAKLIKIAKLEKVTTTTDGSDEVLSTIVEYNLNNIELKNNLYYPNDTVYNSSIADTDFILPDTIVNSTNDIDNAFLPQIGDKLRITFYYIIENNIENLYFTRSAVLYTNKNYIFINKIYVSSGFKASQSTTVLVNSFTQPSLGARYRAIYDYKAPKQNERISIRYNYNKLIGDVTFSIENNRPINADVLAKASESILLDITMNIVIKQENINSKATILQNLKDTLYSLMNTNKLGSTIDLVTLTNAAQGVSGIDRVRVLYFNKNGQQGTLNTIVAQNNQNFVSNNIIINVETR